MYITGPGPGPGPNLRRLPGPWPCKFAPGPARAQFGPGRAHSCMYLCMYVYIYVHIYPYPIRTPIGPYSKYPLWRIPPLYPSGIS